MSNDKISQHIKSDKQRRALEKLTKAAKGSIGTESKAKKNTQYMNAKKEIEQLIKKSMRNVQNPEANVNRTLAKNFKFGKSKFEMMEEKPMSAEELSAMVHKLYRTMINAAITIADEPPKDDEADDTRFLEHVIRLFKQYDKEPLTLAPGNFVRLEHGKRMQQVKFSNFNFNLPHSIIRRGKAKLPIEEFDPKSENCCVYKITAIVQDGVHMVYLSQEKPFDSCSYDVNDGQNSANVHEMADKIGSDKLLTKKKTLKKEHSDGEHSDEEHSGGDHPNEEHSDDEKEESEDKKSDDEKSDDESELEKPKGGKAPRDMLATKSPKTNGSKTSSKAASKKVASKKSEEEIGDKKGVKKSADKKVDKTDKKVDKADKKPGKVDKKATDKKAVDKKADKKVKKSSKPVSKKEPADSEDEIIDEDI